MSIPLTGYTTHRLLRRSARKRVYEAVRHRDARHVVAKVFRPDREGLDARVRHEFRLLQTLDVEGVVRPLALERVGDNMVLVLDHVDGENLHEHARGQPMPVPRFLEVAKSLVATLARVHGRGIVHRDIKPSNILIERVTGAVYLADFGISVLLEDARRHLHEREILEGTLPYLSPEQTGRTKRSVDFRSDLYSLGVTFYELLTGRRPFDGVVPLELVHAHLARRPQRPRALRPELPELLSAIVMKLLEKAPEYRYQSARGLLADLDRLTGALETHDANPDFPLAQFDHAGTLQFPRQLYGREREVATLEAELRTVLRDRVRRLVLIEGGPGIGKSSLIRSLEGPLAAARGRLAIGSFEQGGSTVPYVGIVQAFESLLEQILTEDDESLAGWGVNLSDALGPVAGVVAALVPALALVVGEMPPVPTLPPAEARNRLQLAFCRLLSGLAKVAPLVLALDDVQWADDASVELLTSMALEDGAPLLLVVSHRGPASERLGALEARRAVTKTTLQPLSGAHIERLLADVLGRKQEKLGSLPLVVARKTGNNPLFVRQYLIHLVDLGMLEPGEEGWTWDMEAITSAGIPDDIFGMMEAKLARLATRERELLHCAACIGSRFETELLEAVCEFGDEALSESLYTLETEGLIDPLLRGHRFAHDQLQAVALGLGEDGETRRHRAAIGRHLLDRLGREGLGERVFEVVDQLDASLGEEWRTLATDERLELAVLNSEAGQRALDSAAWLVARRYYGVATQLLEPELALALAGGAHDEWSYTAAFGHAQTLALTGDIEQAEAAFECLLRWDLEQSEYGEVVARRVHVLMLRQRPADALRVGVAGLRLLGYKLPARSTLLHVIFWVIRGWRRCRSVELEQWLGRPQTRDPRLLGANQIINALTAAAYLLDTNLFVVLSGLHACLAAGAELHRTAPLAMSSLAIVVAAALRKPVEAAQLCERALELSERAPMVGARGSAEAATFLFVWPASRPWREFNHRLPAMVARLLEVGDREHAGFSIIVGLAQLFEGGAHLRGLNEQARAWQAEVDQWGTREMRLGCEQTGRLAALLSEPEGASVDRLVSRAQGIEVEATPILLTTLTTCRMSARVLLAELEGAHVELEAVVDDFEQALFGSWQQPRFAMWAAIVDASRFASTRSARERRRISRRLRRYVRVVRRWAAGSPENFGGMLDLTIAERERTRGHGERALLAYDRARVQAQAQAIPLLEGLACLRMAELAGQLGRTVEAHGAHAMALLVFRRWGAKAVVARLERELGTEFSESTVDASEFDTRELLTSSASTSSPPALLDLATVLETMHLISEDLHLDEVVGRVLGSAITSAGADRGVLMLERDGVVGVIAEGDGEQTRSLPTPTALAAMRERLPMTTINYVLRTGTALVLDDASADPRFAGDPYISANSVRSLLCLPIVKHNERVGALLLENRLTTQGFPSERLEVLRFLVAQAASALGNARLYDALQRSEARWRSLVAGAPDTIMLMDNEGRIEFTNHTNVPGSVTVIGRLAEEFLDPNSREGWRRTLAEVVANGQTRELEVCVPSPEGDRTYYMVRVAPVEAGGGKLLSIATDTSERKRLEAQVRQHQRLESIGTLASGVAHEINNPIQGIMNYAELIHDRTRDDIVLEFAGEISIESERVATIVRDLLTFSRQEQDGIVDVVKPRELIESTLSLVHTLMRGDGIGVLVEVPESLPPVRCRSQQIRQIIMNLITNARDALNERYEEYDEFKTIQIRAEEVEQGGRRWIRFEVEDRGTGMPESVQARIFDPFFTTKGRDQGTGLGLAVSHGIAVEHGGGLSVDSERGVGTTMSLMLPLGEACGSSKPQTS